MNGNALPQCAPTGTCFFVRNGNASYLGAPGGIQCETRLLVSMLNWLSLISPLYLGSFLTTQQFLRRSRLSNVQALARIGYAMCRSLADRYWRNPSTNNPDGLWMMRRSDFRSLPCG